MAAKRAGAKTGAKTGAKAASGTAGKKASGKKKAGASDAGLDAGRPADRRDAFADLARRRAEGEVAFTPRVLSGFARRCHVRQTLREDHATRITGVPEAAQAKFDKLARSTYDFFRGTALLFYRDLAGDDAWMPSVLTLGDVHPENFGVMPSADGTPMFGVNDFDEAHFAPFTWDIKRGAVGFFIASGAEGLSKKKRAKVVRAFVRGYCEGLRAFVDNDLETERQLRLDNSPPLIRALIEGAMTGRAEWLGEMLDDKRRGFRPTTEIVPQTSKVDDFQAIVDRYVKENGISIPGRTDALRVKDVAEKRGSGTASLGLTRYFVLIAGPDDDGSDDIVLEMKRARRSALDGLAPTAQAAHADAEAGRVVNAQAVHLVGGDPFYGKVEIEGRSHLVRERSPFKDEMDLDDLDAKSWRRYAFECGRALAQAHALADEDTGVGEGSVEARILDAVEPLDLFVEDMVRFAREGAARVARDHALFCEDHALGAFTSIDRHWK